MGGRFNSPRVWRQAAEKSNRSSVHLSYGHNKHKSRVLYPVKVRSENGFRKKDER